jgi:hypothetical protein
MAGRIFPEGVTPLPSRRGVRETGVVNTMTAGVAHRLGMKRSDKLYEVLWEACLVLCVWSENVRSERKVFDVYYFQCKLVYVCIKTLSGDVRAVGDVAWERENFEDAIRTVARTRQTDQIVEAVMNWDWLIPGGVRSNHDVGTYTPANNEPERVWGATSIGMDFKREMDESEREIAVQLGIRESEGIYRVLRLAVECAAMMKSDASACFDVPEVQKRLVRVCISTGL